MSTSKVRADYEQLSQIAQAFGRQAETAQQVLSALQSNVNTLQGGDWVGKGAEAFYAEMNTAVLPAMQRVVAAMNEAASTTTKISRIMKQAEEDAAALFRLDGAGTGTQVGGNGALGSVEAANVSAFRQPGPDGGGGGTSQGGAAKGGSPSGKPASVYDPNDPRFKRMPPGPGAYTEAEYDDWQRRHPRASFEVIIGKQWKEEYTPAWLQSRGYYYSGTMWIGTPEAEVEIWLSDEGDGKEIRVIRSSDGSENADSLPDPLAEDLQEIQDSVGKMQAERNQILTRLKEALQGKGSSGDADLVKRHVQALEEAIERAEELVELAEESSSPLVPEMTKSLNELYRLRVSIFNDVMTTIRASKSGP